MEWGVPRTVSRGCWNCSICNGSAWGVPVRPKLLEDVLVRRLKEEIQGGFPKREIVQVNIDGLPEDAPELRLSTLLDEYRQLREQRMQNETRRKQAAAGLLMTGLQQRLLSSVEAFARTLRSPADGGARAGQ